ncbi:MAG: DUF438 domain-containing protein [Bacillota bacterium]|jgi:DUF438 domain-containing protein
MRINQKAERLAEILKRLNTGENPEQVRKEAQHLIEQLTPEELSLAEQKLVDEGLAEEELRGLCSVHMEMLQDELEQMKQELSGGHVIGTMLAEHEILLTFLDQLEEANQRVQGANGYNEIDARQIAELGEKLLEAENHHQREEQVLFPELEKRGVSGPPRIMRMEHDDMRVMKKRVRDIGRAAEKQELPFAEFQQQLNEVAPRLVFALRDHIFKENNILYPTALNMLEDEKLWAEMKQRCDEVGYCEFTPQD